MQARPNALCLFGSRTLRQVSGSAFAEVSEFTHLS